MVYSLAKEGWWSGNPQWIFEAPTDMVFQAFNYVVFVGQYLETEQIINTKES